jgi:hypothetical protein
MIITVYCDVLKGKDVKAKLKEQGYTIIRNAKDSNEDTFFIKTSPGNKHIVESMPNVRLIGWANEADDDIKCPTCGRKYDTV